MRAQHLPALALLALLALTTLGVSQEPEGNTPPAPTPDLEERVARIEKELAETREELARVAERAERAEAFAQSLARAAKRMASTLDASEKAGFTAGINFRSREILLAGWREWLSEIERGARAPKPEAAGPPTEKAPPAR